MSRCFASRSISPEISVETVLVSAKIAPPLGGAAGAPESLLALARQGRPDARIVAHDPRSALPPRLAEAVAALTAYLAGDPRPYEGPLDLRGTPFQQAVWRRLLEIPWGTTLTYGELAAALGRPRA